MEKKGQNDNWKAKDSAPMETKQQNDIGVENQTTNSQKNRFPWLTIFVLIVLIFIVGVTLLMGD
jgi:hypothetical protein